jgi:glycosyltransferase involved in cell wall biosynthesis
MNILWLTNIPSPYRVDFFNLLGERCQLTVLFEKEKASDRNKNWGTVEFKSFRGVILNGVSTGADNAFCLNVASWLQKDKYNVIVVSNYSTPTGMLAIQILRCRKIPFVIEVDGGFAKNGLGFKERIKKYLLGSAKYWLSSGKITTEYLIAYGAQKERIFWYPFTSLRQSEVARDISEISEKKQLRSELSISGERVVITVGQFIHIKGFDVLIKAWANMDSCYTLLIIGGGELESEYRKSIEQLSLDNVMVIGFKQKEELFKYYKAADLFVLPTREDIWGLVVNEAMACGLPVITTDKCIAGVELIEDNVNGVIIPAENVEMLSKKVHDILSHEELLNKMAHNSLERIKDFTLEKMVQVHMNLFGKMELLD